MSLHAKLNELTVQLAERIVAAVLSAPMNEVLEVLGPEATPRRRAPRKAVAKAPVVEAPKPVEHEIRADQMGLAFDEKPNPVTGRRRVKKRRAKA